MSPFWPRATPNCFTPRPKRPTRMNQNAPQNGPRRHQRERISVDIRGTEPERKAPILKAKESQKLLGPGCYDVASASQALRSEVHANIPQSTKRQPWRQPEYVTPSPADYYIHSKKGSGIKINTTDQGRYIMKHSDRVNELQRIRKASAPTPGTYNVARAERALNYKPESNLNLYRNERFKSEKPEDDIEQRTKAKTYEIKQRYLEQMRQENLLRLKEKRADFAAKAQQRQMEVKHNRELIEQQQQQGRDKTVEKLIRRFGEKFLDGAL